MSLRQILMDITTKKVKKSNNPQENKHEIMED